jgi:hypothetical protein
MLAERISDFCGHLLVNSGLPAIAVGREHPHAFMLMAIAHAQPEQQTQPQQAKIISSRFAICRMMKITTGVSSSQNRLK